MTALEMVPDVDHRGWLPLNLSPYLDGTHQPPPPALLQRRDGASLLYPGKVHSIAGEPEAMKSWLALLACSQQLIDRRRVLYFDLEDGPEGIVQRLLDMGLPVDLIRDHFGYVNPTGALRYSTRDGELGVYLPGTSLVVIDAVTEALSLEDLSSESDTDVAKWMAKVPKWIARQGPAVLVLDHVVKNSDSRGRWATGSGHKLAGIDGASFTLDVVTPGGRGMVGRSRLHVSKDRPGQVRPLSLPSTAGRHWIADLVVDSTGPWTDIGLELPAINTSSFIPTAVMTKVSKVLETAGKPLTKATLEGRVGGRATVVRQAIAELEDAGHLEVSKGPNNSRLHTLLKPYPTEEPDPT